jgi:hypothetical protein
MIDIQATYYRRRAIVARQSAAAAIDPYVKAAFAEVANHWLGLAEHITQFDARVFAMIARAGTRSSVCPHTAATKAAAEKTVAARIP